MAKIYVAGHRGMVGGAILRQLQARRDAGADLALITRSSAELDLTDHDRVGAGRVEPAPGPQQLGGVAAGRDH